MTKFDDLFPSKKPIIGMIHLAGMTPRDKIYRALEEIHIYQENGLDGAIIEDYHGNHEDVENFLNIASQENLDIVLGINVLRNPYSSFSLARKYGAKFVQFDTVETSHLDVKRYSFLRERHPEISVLGGVGFKYVPQTGNPLEKDLREAMSRCEAIVTTGPETGVETPIEKLRLYRSLINNFPLISGAGVEPENIYEQFQVSDGAIVGSYFKPNKNTNLPVDPQRVKDLVSAVKGLR